MMNKKRGILLVGLLFLLLFALSVMAQEDYVREDVIIGMIVVAILLVIIIIVLITIIRKKFFKLVKPKHEKTKELHEEAPTPIPTKEDAFKPREGTTTEPLEEPKVEEAPPTPPPKEKSGGFLAKARKLQKQAQPQTQAPAPSDQTQPQQDVKISGFQKEELEKSAKSIAKPEEYKMKKCPGCGFDLLADEKECPVCSKKM